MNSKKCKLLRRMNYGDFSQRMERSYVTLNGTTILNHPESPRGRYLEAKKLYKKRRQNN